MFFFLFLRLAGIFLLARLPVCLSAENERKKVFDIFCWFIDFSWFNVELIRCFLLWRILKCNLLYDGRKGTFPLTCTFHSEKSFDMNNKRRKLHKLHIFVWCWRMSASIDVKAVAGWKSKMLAFEILSSCSLWWKFYETIFLNVYEPASAVLSYILELFMKAAITAHYCYWIINFNHSLHMNYLYPWVS